MSSLSTRLAALATGCLLALAAWAWFWPRPSQAGGVGFFEPRELPEAAKLPAEAGLLPSRTGLRRWRLSEEVAARIMPVHDALNEYDEHTYFRYRPEHEEQRNYPEIRPGGWQLRTNSLGLREDVELLDGPADLRVLVAGDSNSEGVCENADSFANRLEARLSQALPDARVECVNAAHSGYSFYQYLGTLERFQHLAPDVFVVAVYGGNDFVEGLKVHHLFHGTHCPAPDKVSLKKSVRIDTFLTAQVTMSALFFRKNPEQIEVALQAAQDVALEIESLCTALGIELVYVYVPPITDVRPEALGERPERLREELGLELADLRVHDGLAQRFLAFLRERRITTVDMREDFRAHPQPPYWDREWHMDHAAQELVAARLLPLVLRTWQRRAPGRR